LVVRAVKKIAADGLETKSEDLVSANVNGLKKLFPEAFTEGKVDFDVLKQLLGSAVDEREEKYGLNWHGKRRARQIALTPSLGTLRPCPEESVEWDTTQNLMIEGDNLEVLELLQKSYARKVKLIYIDPPYNTGKDFVYPDNFHDNIKNYLQLTGQVDGEGRKLSTNSESSGRFHTDWLNMMYPRLKLARNLLTDRGVVFVSIDDNEAANLRAVCDDVFGPENFIANVIWQKIYAPKSSARHFSEDHDYITVYAKDSGLWTPGLLPRTDEQNDDYKNPDDDPRGPWKANNLSARNYYSNGTYSIRCPGGRAIAGPPRGRYWSIAEDKLWQLHDEGRVWWGKDGNNVPAPKIYFSEVKQGRVPQTLWKYEEVGHTQEAKKMLVDLVDFEDSESVFETPKPVRLIARMIQLATAQSTGDIILDFFAGSGTTGHAVLDANVRDGGNRRFVLVQLPEHTGQISFPLISDLTKERLRRVGQKIAEGLTAEQTESTEAGEPDLFSSVSSVASVVENDSSPSSVPLGPDLGFRVFKLDSTNIRAWDPDRENLSETLLNSVEHVKTDRTEADILYELLLKLGLELTVPIEQKTIAGKAVHNVGVGSLFVCLATQIDAKDIEPLAHGIADWHKELAPSGETQVVFRDSAFADDVAKTNVTAILKQRGLENVRSL
jgi:adenine-specific DNA-methyltransferase